MRAGFHYVEDSDTSPPLGAAAFLDVGGDVKGSQSELRLCRPYFKGLLSDAEIVDRVQYWTAQGCGVQLLNEPNLALEQFPGTWVDYASLYYRIKARVPAAKLYWAAPSPGFPGWQEWFNGAEEADGLCLHVYGTLAEMQAVVVETVLRFPGKSIWISECNFGPAAGRYVDLEDWATNHLKPFLDWCAASVPEVEAVTYFAFAWPNADSPQGTPVDGAGTAVERVLREWQQPEEVTTMPETMDDATQIALIEMEARQNAHLTDALIALLKDNLWDGAESVAGQVVALTGKTLAELGISPKA